MISECFWNIRFKAIIYTGFPPITPDSASTVDRATAEILFERISKQGIEFNYMQGNCHNRAHIQCMLLASYGVTPAKIWAFAPGIFSVDDPTLISIPDKNGISATGDIQWGYHVVPFLLIEENGVIETLVFDPSLFPEGPIHYSTWVDKLHIPNLLCLRMDWEWYLYNSLPWNLSELYEDFMLPVQYSMSEESELLTDMPLHDFFMYEMDSKSNFWMERGLAIDETAFSFYNNEIQPLKGIQRQRKLFDDYCLLVGDVNNFETVFRDSMVNSEVDVEFQDKHANVISKYRNIYENNLSKWQKRIASLDSK